MSYSKEKHENTILKVGDKVICTSDMIGLEKGGIYTISAVHKTKYADLPSFSIKEYPRRTLVFNHDFELAKISIDYLAITKEVVGG